MKVDEKKKEKFVLEACPLCRSKMEKGFYKVAQPTVWDTKEDKWWSFRLIGEKIDPLRLAGTNFEAYRCKNCKLIIFQYGEAGDSAGSP